MPREVLGEIYEKYMDYVQHEMLYEVEQKEIADFGEWAENHYAIPREEAEEYFLDYEEGDGATLGARAA